EYSQGEDAYLEAILGKMESYIQSSRAYTRAIVTNLFEDAGEMFDSHSYPKGACVLHMLRRQLGDELFRKSIHHYLKANAPGLVDTDDLMESVEKTTGLSMDQFFEQWVFRAGHPRLQVKHEWLADQKQVKLSLKQTQETREGEPLFVFPLNIEICMGDETIEKTMQISQKEESVFIDCPHAPRSINIDPKISVLMELDHDKSEDMLLYDLEKGSTIIVKIRAIRALADKRSEKIRNALLQAARSDSNLRVRQEALSVLGKDRSPKGLDAHLSMLNDDNPKIRRKVIQSMDGFYKEKKAIDALIDRCRHDSSNNVRADAAEMLAKLKAEKLYPVLKKNLNEKSWQNRLSISAMNALTDLHEKSVYPDLVELSQDPHHRDVRTAAIRCLGRLAEKHESLQKDTLDRLLTYLKSPAESIRRAAVSGLQSLKNEDAVSQLRWIEQNDPEESIRDLARRAIAEIRRGKQNELAGENAGRIDQLEDQNKKLEDQLKKLEEKINAISGARSLNDESPAPDSDS
ncbi:MAG: HEAT repeat domain-containing protein, partial [Candidatus Hinthialibacter sp.]